MRKNFYPSPLFRFIIFIIESTYEYMKTDHTDIPGELKSPSDQFEAASDSFGLYWWHWEHVSKKIRLSEGMVKILGLPSSVDGYLPEEVYQNIHIEDAERNRILLHRLYLGEDELYEIEYRIKGSGGKWQWYYNRGTVIRVTR